MNRNIRGKGNIISGSCSNTSVSETRNGTVAETSDDIIRYGLVEVSQTEIKVTFVGFDHKISKK